MELCLQVVNASIVFIAFTTRNYSSIILYFAIALHFAFVCFIISDLWYWQTCGCIVYFERPVSRDIALKIIVLK